MQNTTADYKIEINKPSRSFECKITIGNNVYTNEDLVNLTLEYAQPQEGFAIGSTVSQSLDLTLLNRGDIIYSTSQIKVEIGLKIGSRIEYILMGIFNIDDIEKTDYTTKFTAYDNMIKFETPYYSSLGDKPTLQQVVNELSSKTGVQFIGSLPSYTVSKLEGFSCREVLSYVASICGGNAFITRDGKFTIKNLGEVQKSMDGSNYFEYTREEVKYKVGQISCQVDENNILSKGSIGTDSMELGFENPWVNETILTEIYNKLKSVEYLGYSMKWQGDISLDPYDIITVTDVKNVVRKIPILSQKLTYTGGLTSEIGAKGETKNKNSFSSSGSTTNKVNRLVTEQAVIKEALIEKANIKDLEASNAKIENLESKTAKIEEAIIDVAYVSDLTAINANIQTLFANDATINNALINKANITDLTATNIKFNVASGGTLDLQTLLSKHITGENGQFINISSSNTVIANAVIKDAMIENVSLNKLLAGTISTNKFNISSDDGGITIVGPTMQFKDKSNKVRLQLGQDTTGDFNFILRASDGTTTLIDGYGIKEKAIADDLIKSNMVAEDAIGEKQINYNSLITGLNKDTNTSLIKASKVAIDLTGQSLEVSFNSLKSNVDGLEIGGRNLFAFKYINPSTSFIKKDENILEMSTWAGLIITNANLIKMIEPNTQYTFRTKIKILSLSDLQAYDTKVSFLLYKKGSPSVALFNYNVKNNKVGDIIEVINTFTSVEDLTGYGILAYSARYADETTAELGRVQLIDFTLVKGNKAMVDWSPAPEDTDQKIESNTTAISVAQGKIEGLISENSITQGDITTLKDNYTSIKATVDGINTTVASNTSSIGTINTNISGLSGKVTTVENNYASLSQSLEGFKTTVANNYSTKSELSGVDGKVSSLTSRVSTAESSITQLNNQIALKIEATDVTEAINNIQIGGKNLLKLSSFNTPSYETSLIKNAQGTVSIAYGVGNDLYESGEYVISFLIKSKFTNGRAASSVRLSQADENSNSFSTIAYIGRGRVESEVWEKLVYNLNLSSKKRLGLQIYNHEFLDGFDTEVYVKDIKIEKGNKITDWTPAPEDVDNAITAADTKITTTNNKVAEIETSLSGINLKVQSTEQIVSTHTTQLGQVDTKINAAQTNAINSAKSYTDGQIKNVNQTITDKVAEIKLTTDSITQKVSSTESKLSSTNTIVSVLENNTNNIWSKDYAVNTATILPIKEFNGIDNLNPKYWYEVEGFIDVTGTNNGALVVFKGNGTTFEQEVIFEKGTNSNHVKLFLNNGIPSVSLYSHTSYYTVTCRVKRVPRNVSTTISLQTTKNQVATIETNLSSITQRVSSTENNITTINGNISSLQSRMSSAEQKITSSAIISTVQSTINTAKTEAINSANSATDTKLQSYATKASMELTASQLRLDFSSSGGSNLIRASLTKETSNVYGFGLRNVDTSLLVAGKKYTLTVRGRTVNGAGSRYLQVYIYTPDWSWSNSLTIKETSLTTRSITFTATSDMITKGLAVASYHYPNDGDRSGSSYIEWYCLTEGEMQSVWMPHHGEVRDGNTIIDANGITVNNGALTIKNKAGTTVFQGDTNGNLVFTGTAKSQNGSQFVSLDSGGLSFQDWNRKEQMLRMGISYFDSNRDMNGITFAMPKYSDHLRFAYIDKTDLTNGWSSSDSQYNFMDFWSGTYTVGGINYKKGINVYAPMYINDKIKFNYSGSTTYTNDILSVEWNSINGLLGVYGDNGAILGYQSGSNLNARIVVTEGAHPGTGDNIKSWGHWNCSGYTVHNATFSGNHVNSYANEVTRTFTETHCIEAENKQVRINFTDIQLVDGKAILNIPKAYIGINSGYIVNSIVKKGKGDVWVLEEQESRFIIEGTADIKVNIEVIINLDNTSSYSLKSGNDEQLCIDMTTGQPIGA